MQWHFSGAGVGCRGGDLVRPPHVRQRQEVLEKFVDNEHDAVTPFARPSLLSRRGFVTSCLHALDAKVLQIEPVGDHRLTVRPAEVAHAADDVIRCKTSVGQR